MVVSLLGWLLGWLMDGWDGCWGGWMDVGMVVSMLRSFQGVRFFLVRFCRVRRSQCAFVGCAKKKCANVAAP
jgi:hypothetical protein